MFLIRNSAWIAEISKCCVIKDCRFWCFRCVSKFGCLCCRNIPRFCCRVLLCGCGCDCRVFLVVEFILWFTANSVFKGTLVLPVVGVVIHRVSSFWTYLVRLFFLLRASLLLLCSWVIHRPVFSSSSFSFFLPRYLRFLVVSSFLVVGSFFSIFFIALCAFVLLWFHQLSSCLFCICLLCHV